MIQNTFQVLGGRGAPFTAGQSSQVPTPLILSMPLPSMPAAPKAQAAAPPPVAPQSLPAPQAATPAASRPPAQAALAETDASPEALPEAGEGGTRRRCGRVIG